MNRPAAPAATPLQPLLARLVEGLRGDAPSPLYLRLAAGLRGLIEAGELRGGEAMPSERELVRATRLSRVTVRKATDALCREGIVARRHGAGSFVTRQIDQPLSVLVGFSEDMKRRGATVSSRILQKLVCSPDPSDLLKLGLSPSDLVFRLARVRLSDGEPLAIENAIVPADAIVPENMGESLYEALRASGHMPVRALQRLRAAVANAQEAQLLGVPLGSPVLHIERRAFLANGRPIEVTTSSYRGDRYDFIAELTLEP
ncbi:GntR family transcriptional regulator [Phaeovulum sp.]|jgi:GntR family transcriptional regulator|uniref:GntR family transcriptional regulator n=1 Tax=Phaeovulum sp. TaxID=2934796 RepID=UPI00272F9808|nr:GntR family transcriptional regulator [Phaeovulum sp.]MDP1667754.1 GntR family transcriptional regulator [Phaeovulum sp.]MDP2062918.1 GntR family transcriptional regulator [Phaeovulum sp.]MDP3862281.1 GntR family transcriptional regulator [Phaeovulum sp.]MDZ4118355.1 GntR family transcriptional regulator [Phaeovulum sp.]